MHFLARPLLLLVTCAIGEWFLAGPLSLSAAEAPPPVEILLRGAYANAAGQQPPDPRGLLLTPTAAFELRFAEPMVRAEKIGVEAAESPLAFTPNWPGAFRWTSERGGVFTPSEASALGMTYRASLRPGLVKADGEPFQGDAQQTFRAPPFEVTATRPITRSNYGVPLEKPVVHLAFNALVDPTQAERSFSFQNAGGLSVAAAVRALTPKEWAPPARYYGLPVSYTWKDQFRAAHSQTPEVALEDGPPLNQLIVTPVSPLPVGKDWKLVAAEGLPGKEASARLLKAYELSIGDIKSFVVEGLNVVNGGNDARKLSVRLSRPAAAEVTAETIERWLNVSPKPANFQVKIPHAELYRNDCLMEISGDFALDTSYEVTLREGMPADGSIKLETEFAKTAEFHQKAPELHFPDFSVHQLSAGRREFTMEALNTPEIHLRAKLFRPDAAPMVLMTYHKDYQTGDDHGDPRRVDFDKMPGEVIYDTKIAGSKEIDETETMTLRWNDILGARRNGIVLLEAEQPAPTGGQKKRAGVQALVQITDLGVAWKTAHDGQLLAYVFSLADARPAVGATVQLLDELGHALAQTQTGADGIVRLPADADKITWLSTAQGEDCHVVPFSKSRRDSLSLYRFRLPPSALNGYDDYESDDVASAKPKAPERDVLIFSDRGVYKPGEIAHIKAIVREWRDNGLVNPAPGTVATLRAVDPRGRKFWEKSVKLTDAGSLAEEVALPKSTLGGYRVEVHFSGESAADNEVVIEDDAEVDDEDAEGASMNVCRFQVQEYQPNAFEVAVAKPKVSLVGAGKLTLPLTARYYMGKALSRAKAVWSITAADTQFKPEGFDDYTFCQGSMDYRLRRERGAVSLDGQGALSEQGELLIEPEISLNDAAPQPRRVQLQASVTDQDQQTVTARAKSVVHSSDFYLGVREMPDVMRAGQPLPLEVVAVSAADARPCARPLRVSAKLSRIDWRTNQIENGVGGSDYDGKPVLKPVGAVELDTIAVHRLGKQWEPTEVKDAVEGKLIPDEAGEYLLEVFASDTAGREARTAMSFDVLGEHEAEWNFRNQWQAQLVPDRAQYAPGETATVLIKTPISGRALVTVEREGVSRAFVADIDKKRPAVQVPILAGDAPNVYVSVLLLRGVEQSPRRIKEPEYRAGYCQISVAKTDSKLAVDVRPARAEYQPGEEVAVRVAVTDAAHRPAPGAEVTLYAVDKGVLSLTGYTTPEPLRAFYRPRPLGVRTGLTLPSLLSEDPAYFDAEENGGFSNKGYLVGGGGNEGMSERMRRAFVACAYWNAALTTDAQGCVEARFTAPDNLSQFQIMAVVHEGGRRGEAEGAGRFGSGESEFRINKPLMLEPAMPRFGNVGDRLKLRAVLHNQSPSAGEAEVTLELDDKAVAFGADGLPSMEARARRVRLAAGESKSVDFPVEFRKTGQAQWIWRARLTGDGADGQTWRDSVQTTLNVNHPTPRRAEIVARRLDEASADDLLARVNPELLEGEDGVVQVSLSSSRLNDLREGLRALLHYPYGCVEQTTSSLLPWLTLQDFGDALPDIDRPKVEVTAAVERGVNRLLSMQTDSGGLAYWPGESGREAHPWGSAYGGVGLALARKAGFFVPESNFNRLCAFLSKQLRSGDKATRDTYHEHSETDRCLALYALALAGKSEAAYCEQLFNRRNELCPEDRALLALAIAEGKGSAEMARILLSPGLRETEKPDTWNAFASGAALEGMRLLAWCHIQNGSNETEALMGRLIDQRGSDGTWRTTQGNAWALLAMGAYARQFDAGLGVIEGTVALGGQSRPFRIDGEQRTFVCEFSFGAAALAAGDGAKPVLTVTNRSGRSLYMQAKVESRPRGGAALASKPAAGEGEYVINRRYEKVRDDGTLAPAEGLKVGDRVLVSLDVQAPGSASYVAVDDPLPAVLEAVNPEFKTQDAGNAPMRAGYAWWSSDFRELREDRAVFFRDRLYAGNFHLQYLARVRAAGTATAPAARIEEMYHPERYAQTASSSLTAAPME